MRAVQVREADEHFEHLGAVLLAIVCTRASGEVERLNSQACDWLELVQARQAVAANM